MKNPQRRFLMLSLGGVLFFGVDLGDVSFGLVPRAVDAQPRKRSIDTDTPGGAAAKPAAASDRPKREADRPTAREVDKARETSARSSRSATSKITTTSTTTEPSVKIVQEALKSQGFDPGPVDATMGPKTQAALREFQKASSLPETGKLDQATVKQLGIDR